MSAQKIQGEKTTLPRILEHIREHPKQVEIVC
jgi:hypothetical protein